jgi:hypothetical protein
MDTLGLRLRGGSTTALFERQLSQLSHSHRFAESRLKGAQRTGEVCEARGDAVQHRDPPSNDC